MLLNETGRPEIVYGPSSRGAQLEHEVGVTEAELLLGGHFTRDEPVGNTTADGMLVRDGERYYVEVDNETMTAEQMRDKWKRYAGVTDFILVICYTKRRLKLLMQSAEAVKDIALFTRFRWLWSGRVREPWIDCSGIRGGI